MKVSTGGKVRERVNIYACRIGENPIPTVIVWMKEGVCIMVKLGITIVVVFLVSILAEYILYKIKGVRVSQKFRINRLVIVAMLSAIAILLNLFGFPLWFVPGFYKLDISSLPSLIGGFALGPVAGVAVEAIKILLNLLINGTKTACIGEISNFVISCAFVLPASVIYYANKTRKNAFIGLICGVVINCIVGALLNAYLLIPLYAKVFYKTEDISGIIKAGTDKNSLIHDLRSFILFAVVPFNLIKTVLVTVVTGIIYKPVSHLLKKPV